MSDVQRSITSVAGNLTVNNGDIIITEPEGGITMVDNVGDTSSLKIVDDGGVKTLIIEEQ